MMETHWIFDIMSVVFLIPTQEFGGTVMMTITLKIVVFQVLYILERVTNKKQKRGKLFMALTKYFWWFISEKSTI